MHPFLFSFKVFGFNDSRPTSNPLHPLSSANCINSSSKATFIVADPDHLIFNFFSSF